MNYDFTKIKGPKPSDSENFEQLVSVFEGFAPYYRKYLRPIDSLIVSSIRLTPKVMSLGMRDFYEFLSREAVLVKAFERWWDHVSEILRSLTKQIPRYDETRKLLKALEAPDLDQA